MSGLLVLNGLHTNSKSQQIGGGRKDGLSIGTINRIRAYYNNIRDQALSVLSQQLKIEAMRVEPLA
jgi:hypothetical protein